MKALPESGLHHVEVYVSDLDRSAAFLYLYDLSVS